MNSELEIEILELISITWNDNSNIDLDKKYVIRFWSIDTQWMNFNKAEKLINELILKEWINEDNGKITPNFSKRVEINTFGWKPNKIMQIEIPKNKFTDEDNIINTKKEKISVNKNFNNLSSSERRLARYISANTGILKEEIIRRSERKKRNLGQITYLFCLLLIAKEQGMDMNEIIDGI